MKNLEIFELCIEVNSGWRSRYIKIEKAADSDMFGVAPADMYNVYVFTNDDIFDIEEANIVLFENGISVRRLEFTGEDAVVAKQNGYKNCFHYVSNGENDEMPVAKDTLWLNDVSMASFKNNERNL